MTTYSVVLTRVSDSLKLYGTLADGQSARQSVPYSADSPGRPGRIVLTSFHKGSGLRMSAGGEEQMYKEAEGWDAVRKAHVRSVGIAGPATVLSTAYPTASDWRKGAIFQHPDALEIVITPEQIYENGTLVDSATAGNRFTGSYAVFGDRTFFGMEVTTTDRASKALCRVRTGTTVGTYANTDFAASYFAVVGARLFRVVQNAAYPKISASWTDDTGTSTPTWFTSYTYPTEQYVMDAANLGGAFVMAVGGVLKMPGEVVTLDIGGSFTNIIPPTMAAAPGLGFLPFRGGLIFLVAGALAESLFMADVGNVAPLSLHPSCDREIELPLPTSQGDGVPSLLCASAQNAAFIGYASATGASWGWGHALLFADEAGQITAHRTPLPPAFLPSNYNTLAVAITRQANTPDRLLRIAYINRTAAGNNDLEILSIPLYNGYSEPPFIQASTTGDTGAFVTPEYIGDSLGIKQVLAISGQVKVSDAPTTGTLTFKLGLTDANGVVSYITLPGLVHGTNLGGPFHFELPETARGRSFFLTWTFVSTGFGSIEVMCPITIDYAEVPNQRAQASLPLLLGSLQIAAGGGMQKQARKVSLAVLEDALKDPSPWTIQWWDDVPGSPSWTVLIESFKSSELEEDGGRPGSAAAVATLVVRRLNTTARVI